MSAHKDGIWRELYPFQSYVRMLDGHRYHYLDEGKGPVLLMVHGNPTWSFYWRNLVLAFRDRFRCVVVDHIGCGLSAKPQDYPYTLAQHIRNLRWLVEQLNLQDVTLLAHDWGGAIGLGTAVAMPQRFGRFILFNTAAFRDTRIPFRIRTCRVPYWGALSVRGMNGFARAALTWATEKPERMTAAVKAGLIAPYDSWANRIATHRFVQDIPLKPSHPSYGTLASIEAGLAQFKRRPVQFIWGMKDWCFTPHFLERFVDEFFPDAEVNPIDDAGHYVVEDAYEEIIPLVEDFLTRHGVLKGKASPAETWEKGKAKGPETPVEKPAVKEPPAKPATPPPMEMVRSAASQVELPRLADSLVELPKADAPKAAPPAVPLPPAPAPSQVPVTSDPLATSMPIRGTAMIEFPPAATAPSTTPDPFAATDSSVEIPRAFVAPPPPFVAPVSETERLPTVPAPSKEPAPSEEPETSMPIRGTAMIEFPPAATPSTPDPFAATDSSVEMVPRGFVAPSLPPLSPVRETAIPAAPNPPIDRSSPSLVPMPESAPEVDEYPFPRMTAPTTPVAPPIREPKVDEYPFPKLTPATPTPASIVPAAPVTPPVTSLPSPPAVVTEPRTSDPSIGETRIPEGGFPSSTVTPESIAPQSPASESPAVVEPRAHDPAIGDTRLPADDSVPLGAELSGSPASEAADQVIRESKREGLEDKSRPALPASSSNFTPDMVTQPTVLNMKAAAEKAVEHLKRSVSDAATTPRESESRLTPTGTPHGSPFGRKPAPPPEPVPDDVVNVALRLRRMAAIMPEALAVIAPAARDENGKRVYDRITFSQLDRVSDRLARGLKLMGVEPGTRLALMVPPGIQFVALVFGLFKAGVVTILIDPGMGRKNLLKCLSQAQPQGFVGIPLVHKIRRLLFWRFRNAKYNVVVGGHQPVGGAITFDQLRGGTWNGHVLAHTKEDDPAAIIFTTGSTGPPKGVLYRHGNFDAQVEALQEFYRIKLGEVSLSGFPLFTLFDAAMGVTSVIPDMDATRPANVDPRNILEAVNDLHVTQAFASPAMWNRVGTYCESENLKMPTLKRVLSAGAAVPEHVLKRMQRAISAEGDVHTPYGATEALPVASIGARELLPDLAAKSRQGAGTCVGKRFGGIEWRVIRIDDAPIPTVEDAQELATGEIGELIVSGPVVTREYFEREEATRWAKLTGGGVTRSGYLSGPTVWHRMGDVGYLDEAGRFWYCGRLTHRVRTVDGTLYTEPCEAIFNTHPLVYRSALVGVGRAGKQTPVIILEPHAGRMPTGDAKAKFLAEIRTLARSNPKTERIERFLLHPSLPVDIRHNSKIFREKLARWARWRVW